MRLPIREVRATEQASLRVYNRFINLRYDWREPSDNPFSLHVKTRPRHMSYAEGCRKRFSRLASSYVEYRELLNQMVQEDRGYAIFDMSADECYAVARDAREHQNTTFEPFLVSHMTDSQKKAFDKRKMCGGIAKVCVKSIIQPRVCPAFQVLTKS